MGRVALASRATNPSRKSVDERPSERRSLDEAEERGDDAALLGLLTVAVAVVHPRRGAAHGVLDRFDDVLARRRAGALVALLLAVRVPALAVAVAVAGLRRPRNRGRRGLLRLRR